jgi:hypothetical protein
MTKRSPAEAAAANGHNHGRDGRFTSGNTAARRTGLRSGSKLELRHRNRRVSQLQKRLAIACADAGRPLDVLSLPLAWKWAELETLRVDLYAALQHDLTNSKFHEQFLAVTRLQVHVERELVMTPAWTRLVRPTEPSFMEQLARRRRELEATGGLHALPEPAS